VAICAVVAALAVEARRNADNRYFKLEGERQSVSLPACKVIRIANGANRMDAKYAYYSHEDQGRRRVVWPNVEWTHGAPQDSSFYSGAMNRINVLPADSAGASLRCGSDVMKYLSTTVSGDTLTLSLDFGNDKIDEKYGKKHTLYVIASEWTLRLPAHVEAIASDLYGMTVNVNDFQRDSIAIGGRSDFHIYNSRFRALSVDASERMFFHNGEVGDLHLTLGNGRRDMQINTDSVRVGTEYLYGKQPGEAYSPRPGEARRIVWRPENERASLDLHLSEGATISMRE
jgi:hypothetical protein